MRRGRMLSCRLLTSTKLVFAATSIALSGCSDSASEEKMAALHGKSDSSQNPASSANSPDSAVEQGVSPSKNGTAHEAEKKSDGFPSGRSTAEGVATDLARAFITNDSKLFVSTCLDSSGTKNNEYADFIRMAEDDMAAIKRDDKPVPAGPVRIKRVFNARHLTKNGPASYGYAVHKLQDVMFVDVEAELSDRSVFLNRTLVVQLPDNSWRVMPRPDLFPLLSMGLNDETDSASEWKP